MRKRLALGVLVACGLMIWGLQPRELAVQDRGVDLAFIADIPVARPLRIAVLGTSLSHGEMWPDALAERLAGCLERPVQVEVIARPGASVVWGTQTIGAVALTDPDIVLVEFATNDADVFDGVSLRRSRQLYADLSEGLGAAVPEAAVILMTMNPVVGIRRMQRPWLRAQNRQYKDFAVTYDVGLIDLAPRWDAFEGQVWTKDGLHPEPEFAAQLIGPAIADFILRESGAPQCSSPSL